ncbi:hypothetical protein HYC85_013677 [Camellia sinensis]|uniref:PGG domain-containing protein n=2 Tax=Camellia sinensis TaxID=4442 RepID=A0A7J7H413_CAMSI|nr:hypothetical protein HYC85_013677 [Camellia sinensis]
MAERFLEAIQHDDIAELGPKLESFLAQEDGPCQGCNPLLIACEQSKVKCAMEIIRLKPELVWGKNQEGYSPMHFSSEDGLVPVVKALAELTVGLCHVRDNNSRTPLHVAALKGREEVVRTLVMACPESLKRMTSLQETALHLALKQKQYGAFEVLMKEIQKHKQEELLNWKDHEGNTLLHIATSHKQPQIVQLILNSTEVQVNLQNMKGFTALDLLNQNFSDSIDNDISQLLLQAGAKEGYALQSFEIQTHHHPQPPSPPIPKSPKFKEMMVLSLSSMTKSVLLAVFIFLAGATYSCLFSLTNIYPRENRGVELAAISFKDLISASHRLPKIFYFLVFNTVTFAGSMIVILLNTWSLVNEWSLCFRAIPMFVMGALLVSYALIVKEIIPKFWVIIGTYKISSFCVVWLYNLPVILFIVLVWVMVKHILSTFSKLRKGLRTNKSSNN